MGQPTATVQMQQQYVAQMAELQRRASSLDANNVDLHQQLARSEQHIRVLQQDLDLVRGQLAETSNKLVMAESSRAQSAEQLAALEASMQRRGGAIITANSSLRQDIAGLNVPGVEARHDGGFVRVELPADRLFQSGTANLLPDAYTLIDQVATSIKTRYPTGSISIEGHTDSDPVFGPWGNNDQLSAAQAAAVLQILSVRHQMDSNRFQVFGRGSTQPVASNGTPQGKAKNRRVELVIQATGS
jgi:flagellar motor protein MotB